MTTTSKIVDAETPLICPQAWAREQLEISADASLHDVQNQFCTVLEDEGFVPYTFQANAYEMLKEPQQDAAPVAEEYLMADEMACCDAIAAFAQEAAELSPDQRETRLKQLERQCLDQPRAMTRLHRLTPLTWLKAPAEAEFVSPDARVLITNLARILATPPLQRGQLRRQCLDAAAAEAQRWSNAATEVRKKYSGWATVDPWLLDCLCQSYLKVKEAEHAAALARLKPASSAAATTARGGKNKFPWWVIVIGVFALKAAFFAASRSSNSNPNVNAPTRSTPYDFRNYSDSSKHQRDLDEILQRIRAQRDGRQNFPAHATPPSPLPPPSTVPMPRNYPSQHPYVPTIPQPGRPPTSDSWRGGSSVNPPPMRTP